MENAPNHTSKTIISSGAQVTFNAKVKEIIKKVNENVEIIANKTQCDFQQLLNYVEAAGTKVFRLDNADKFLALIHEEEGFITEQKGLRAIYLSVITRQKPKLKTEPMFILRDGVMDKYYLLHNFYRWYSMKLKLPGFDYISQKKFKQYLKDNSNEATKKLDINDIVEIKEAIARDNDASEFVLAYTKAIDGSKNVMNKIKKEGSASV